MWTNANEQSSLVSDQEFDRLEEARKILVDHYPYAKDAILTLEVYAKKRSERAVYELRDMLDHISIALHPDTSPAEARAHFMECQTHLRRAAIEPFEWLAETKFLEIERITIKAKWIYRLLFIKPPEGHEILTDLAHIAEKIKVGRVTKGTAESVEHMKGACMLATEALNKIRPKEFYDRAYHLFLGLMLIVITLVAEHVVNWLLTLWRH